ncbi:MAG: PilZ domain-containing protein [Gammaproteobacteria bacterium]|nr:PilZ domain-containing protein [Gammaproteobacteria bacterium]
MEKPNNAREFTRLAVPVNVEVKVGGNISAVGIAHNISMNGILLHSDQELAAGTICEIHIILGEEEPLVIVSHGEVIRSDEQGIAITFSAIELEGLPYMKNLLLYNAPDTNQIHDEFSSHVGLHRK